MHRCLISLGSNLGSPKQNVAAASQLLTERLAGDSLTFSPLYGTPPIGGPAGQKDFVNGVVRVETSRSVFELWDLIREIEATLGRQRQQRWEARRIDLDILLYDDFRSWTSTFKVPHPRFVTRKFLLEPACEIASDWTDPVSNMTIQALAAHLKDETPSIWILWDDRERLANFLTAVVPKMHLPSLQGSGVVQLEDQPGWIGWSLMDVEPLGEGWKAEPPSRTQELSRAVRHATIAAALTKALVHAPSVGSDRMSAGLAAAQADRLPGRGPARRRKTRRESPRLLCLATSLPATCTQDWETWSRGWGEHLGIVPSEHGVTPVDFPGPRYLLDAGNIAFAAHEIRAALTAMDCIIEPLS